MKKKLWKYTAFVEAFLKNEASDADREVLRNLLIQIQFFQHERLIHLLVTLLVALLFVIGILYAAASPE